MSDTWRSRRKSYDAICNLSLNVIFFKSSDCCRSSGSGKQEPGNWNCMNVGKKTPCPGTGHKRKKCVGDGGDKIKNWSCADLCRALWARKTSWVPRYTEKICLAMLFWRNMNQRGQRKELAGKRTSTSAVSGTANGYSQLWALLL